MKITFLLFLLFGVLGDSFAQSDVILPGGVKNGNGATSGQVLKWNGSAWVPGADDTGAADGNGIISSLPSANVEITSTNDLTLRGSANVKARYDTLGSAFSNPSSTEFITTGSAGPGGSHRFRTSVTASSLQGSGFKECVEGRTFIDWKTPGTSGYANSFLTSLYTGGISSSTRGIHMFKSAGTSWNTPAKISPGDDIGFISWASTDTIALSGSAPEKYTSALTSPSSGITGFVYKTFNYQKFYGGLKFWTTEGNRTLIAALQLDTLTKSILPVEITATRLGTAGLKINSTTGGLVPPRMTTAQRDAMTGVVASTQIWNTTTAEMQYWNGAAWATIGSGSDNWGAQTVSTTARLSGNGTSGSQLDIAQQGATNNQALLWNGTTWAPGNTVSIGSFSNSSNSQGLSQSTNQINMMSTSYTSPGGVNLTDQILGYGTKTVSKDGAASITTGLIVANFTAENDDGGSQLSLATLDGDNAYFSNVIVGGSRSGGTETRMSNYAGSTLGFTRFITANNRDVTLNGAYVNSIVMVGSSVTLSNANKENLVIFNTAGGTLTLPDPASTSFQIGTEIKWENNLTTGAACTVNSSRVATTNEFMVAGGTKATSLSINVGTSGLFRLCNIDGTTPYWRLIVFN